MDDLLKILEPWMAGWPLWLLYGLIILWSLSFCIQQVLSAVNTFSQIKLNNIETKVREEELAAIKKKQPSTKIPAVPKVQLVGLRVWLLSSLFTILNIGVFVSVVTSEPVTTLKAGVTALSILGAAWSFLTPISSNVVRFLIYGLKEQAWIAETTLGAHVLIAKEQSDFVGKIAIAQSEVLRTLITQRDLLDQKDFLDRLSKQLEEIDRLLKEHSKE
jgi:hypothetical protein